MNEPALDRPSRQWKEPGEMTEAERADLLPRMVQALGLDPAATRRDHPEVMLSLEAACAMCEPVDRCARALDDDTASATLDAFCANAPVLRAVAQFERSLSGG